MPRVTKPIGILDANIISTNVVESTEQQYAMDVVYGLGELARTEGVNEHRIWRSVHGVTVNYVNGNKGYNPLAELDIDNPVHWALVGSTNRYKALDTTQSSQTINTGSVQYVFGNGIPRFNLVSILNISEATSVSCVVLGVDGVEVYSQTKVLMSNAGVTNFWRFLFWPRHSHKSVVFENITPLTGCTVTLTITGANTSEVGCGLIVIGNSISFDATPGTTTVDYGATTSVRDFSIRDELPTGDYRFKRGPATRDGKFTFLILKESYDLWNEVVADIGPEPFLFTATNLFDSTTIFGLFGKADASIDHFSHCRVTTEIKGLI